MKVLFFLKTMLLSIILLTSCSEGDNPINQDQAENQEEPTSPEITIPDGHENFLVKDLVFGSKGGEKTIAFKSNVNWNISASSIANENLWCNIYPTSGKAGENLVLIKAEENTSFDERNLILTLTAKSLEKKIKVIQKQKDALTLTADKFELDSKGGKIHVDIKSNTDYEVVIPTEYQEWISQVTDSRGLTVSNLTFNIAPSEEANKREGKIIIKSDDISETIHVYQTGQKILLLTQNEYKISAEKDTIQVELKSNFDFEVIMPQVKWISKTNPSRAISSHTLYYTIEANDSSNERDASIIFCDKDRNIADTLHIVQAPKSVLILGKKEFKLNAKGGNIEVNINEDMDYNLDIDSPWITQIPTEHNLINVLMFVVHPNESLENRTGKIIVTNKDRSIIETITINQSAKGEITITKSNFNIEAEGDTIEVEILTNVNLSVKINQNWVQQIPSNSSQAQALGKQAFYFRISPNEVCDRRKAEIEFFNKTEEVSRYITINQVGKNTSVDEWESENENWKPGNEDWWKPETKN